MSIEEIKNKVIKQIVTNNIKSTKINILEEKYAFIVQVTTEDVRIAYNTVFDKKGTNIVTLGSFFYDSGSIYNTKFLEKIDENGNKYKFPIPDDVYMRELDEHHFIIPRNENGQNGNILFYIDRNNKVSYKGFIKGKIEKSILENKLLLTTVMINETNDEKECYFYSWDLNCRTSDKWSSLDNFANSYYIKYRIIHEFKFPPEVAEVILNFICKNNAWLATIKINSADNKYHLNFLTIIGLDGIPLLDLNYIRPDFSIGKIILEKKAVGEVDEKRLQLEQIMKQKMLEAKINKENMALSFLNVNALEEEKEKYLLSKNKKN